MVRKCELCKIDSKTKFFYYEFKGEWHVVDLCSACCLGMRQIKKNLRGKWVNSKKEYNAWLDNLAKAVEMK